ncbi:MAG: FAD-dependent thymidylate synthase [Candidatus Lambdaproteobacteria bacterium]|nr:FAD-dependent thymidylate synthase [Candidatus Lambdaproteobacteria bacterium]
MTGTSQALTGEERALLAPYVTDTEGPVFALTNLPEVIKGALFSRYSRSAKGLRRLLLDEFIQGRQAEFAALAGSAGGAAAPATGATLALAKAQDFYDRILDGYGDDSIGELGGAHVALEGVSMIATKLLEDARIGGSPLEKSTRYVSFAEQHGGDFLFLKEPTLLASRHGAAFLATCRALFETYRDLLPPMTAHIERAAPRPPETSEAAWQRSVRARAYDALRGLLPAATLTNMGIYGNGRFWESLLMRLHLSPLAELRGLAPALQGELDKVIPSFVRRGHPSHPHFAGFREHAAREGARLAALAVDASAAVARAYHPGPPRSVELIGHDPAAETEVLAALAYPHGDRPLAALRRWAEALPEGARARLFADLAALRGNRRHKPPRAFELAYYTFDLLGDFGMYRDLHRHRMLTQQRQPLSTRHGYTLPEEVGAAGLAAPFEAAMTRAAETYEAIRADHPAEAQYVVPMAYRIRWMMRVNLRALIWLVELRSTPQGHPAYRRMAQELYRRVAEVHPRLAVLFRFVDLNAYPLGRLAAEERNEQRDGQRSEQRGGNREGGDPP